KKLPKNISTNIKLMEGIQLQRADFQSHNNNNNNNNNNNKINESKEHKEDRSTQTKKTFLHEKFSRLSVDTTRPKINPTRPKINPTVIPPDKSAILGALGNNVQNSSDFNSTFQPIPTQQLLQITKHLIKEEGLNIPD